MFVVVYASYYTKSIKFIFSSSGRLGTTQLAYVCGTTLISRLFWIPKKIQTLNNILGPQKIFAKFTYPKSYQSRMKISNPQNSFDFAHHFDCRVLLIPAFKITVLFVWCIGERAVSVSWGKGLGKSSDGHCSRLFTGSLCFCRPTDEWRYHTSF